MNSFRFTAADDRTRRMYTRTNTLVLFLACSTTLSAAGGQARYTSVPLKVTVNASEQLNPLTGTTTDASPDSYGQYIDGQNGVCASFNTQGDLIVSFDCKSSSTPRRLGFNLSNSVAPPTNGTNTCTVPSTISPTDSVAYTNYISTAPAADMSTAAFQSMGVYNLTTGSPVYYIQLSIQTALSDAKQNTYRLNYHRTTSSPFPADAARASYAEVRRTSPTEWVIEPVTPSSELNSQSNIAMLVWVTTTHNTQTTTECGFYEVPFSLTLDQK